MNNNREQEPTIRLSGLANAFELADLAEEDGLSVVRAEALSIWGEWSTN